MTNSTILDLTMESIIVIMIFSFPPIVVAAIVGTGFGLLQAVLQVQEQTLSFAVKLITVSVVILMGLSWSCSHLLVFTDHLFDTIPKLPR